jgi:hypothetical protein
MILYCHQRAAQSDPVDGPYEGDHSPELRDPPFVRAGGTLRGHRSFAAIRERDILRTTLRELRTVWWDS